MVREAVIIKFTTRANSAQVRSFHAKQGLRCAERVADGERAKLDAVVHDVKFLQPPKIFSLSLLLHGVPKYFLTNELNSNNPSDACSLLLPKAVRRRSLLAGKLIWRRLRVFSAALILLQNQICLQTTSVFPSYT